MLIRSLHATVIALTGFFICVQSLPGPNAPMLSKRMYATGNRATSSGELGFNDVYNGGFQPAPGTRGITRDIPRFYNGMYFYHRAPVFTFYRGQRISKLDLDVALATFNRFHVYDLVEGQYTTIERDGSDATRAIRSAWHGDIEAYMRRAFSTSGRFGRHISLVVHGHPMRTGRYKKIAGFRWPESPPTWNTVFRTVPFRQDPRLAPDEAEEFRLNLRRKLDTQRSAHFRSLDNSRAIGIRALHNGNIEYEVRDMIGRVSRFHP